MKTYSEDEMIEAKRVSFQDGERHNRPSKKTEDFINMTDKRLELIDFRMKGIEDDVKEIKESLKKSDEKFDRIITKLDERYASKATEIAVTRIGWMVVSAVLLALLGLVLTK